MNIEEQVSEIVRSKLDGIHLWDIEEGDSRLRIFLDSPEGIDLDAIEKASRIISKELNGDADPESFSSKYTLEVSSPGMERILRKQEHYEMVLGSDISIKLKEAIKGEWRFSGNLSEVSEKGIQLDLPDGSMVQFGFADIEKAKTVFKWPAKAGNTQGN